MLNLKRVLLVVEKKSFFEANSFEAIKEIKKPNEIAEVLNCYKTPFISRKTWKRWKRLNMHHALTISVLKVPYLKTPKQFIRFCHENSFECGELVKKQSFDTRKEECFLCGIANHETTVADFNKQLPKEKVSDTIIYESPNFFVKIELGCMIPGMLMINPKEHFYSMAELPSNLLLEFYEVKRDVEKILKMAFGANQKVIFFEHGSSPTGFSSHEKSIVHAHTHVVIDCPIPSKYLDDVRMTRIKNITELKGKKYFYYEQDDIQLAISDPKVYIPRQYPRQIIGYIRKIPNKKTNWRVETFHDNMIETLNKLYLSLSRNVKEFDERIISRTMGFVKGYTMR